MNAKQEAEKLFKRLMRENQFDDAYTVENLLKELKATERKLAEAEKVVMRADALQKVRMSEAHTFMALAMADNELNAALKRYKDYEASKGE